MSNLIKNTSLYTFGNILPKASQFLLLPLYTHYLSPEDYGIVQSMAVLSTILTIFFTMAIERSIYRLYFDYKTISEKRDFLGSIFLTLLINSTILLIIVLFSNSIVSKLFNSIPFYPYYLYAILTVYFTVFGLVPLIYFQVEHKAGKFILISIAEFFISTALIIYFIVYAGEGASGYLLGKLIQSILFLPVFVYIIKKIINFTYKKEIMRESLSYSWPLVPMLLSAWILNLSDRIFIERYSTLRDVGLYSLSYKMAEVLLLFTAAFNKAYEPLFFQIANQNNQKVAKAKLFRYNKVFTIILIMGALLITLFSKEFMYLMDAKYITAYKLVPLIMVGVLIGQISGLFNRSIYQVKKTKQIMILTAASAILNIFLNFLLVPEYGSYGAALSTTITFFFFFIIKYIYSKKCYFIPVAWKEVIPYFALFILIILFFEFIDFSFSLTISLKLFAIFLFGGAIFFRYRKLIMKIISKYASFQ